jgi:hypothetical protein
LLRVVALAVASMLLVLVVVEAQGAFLLRLECQ